VTEKRWKSFTTATIGFELLFRIKIFKLSNILEIH